MTTEQLKKKWGGSLPTVGDWVIVKKWLHRIDLGYKLGVVHETFSPIPLTREVLESIEEVKEAGDNDAYLVGHGYFEYGDSPKLTKVPLPLSGLVQFKYLHQLQQLYRLLTGGEELTIEL